MHSGALEYKKHWWTYLWPEPTRVVDALLHARMGILMHHDNSWFHSHAVCWYHKFSLPHNWDKVSSGQVNCFHLEKFYMVNLLCRRPAFTNRPAPRHMLQHDGETAISLVTMHSMITLLLFNVQHAFSVTESRMNPKYSSEWSLCMSLLARKAEKDSSPNLCLQNSLKAKIMHRIAGSIQIPAHPWTSGISAEMGDGTHIFWGRPKIGAFPMVEMESRLPQLLRKLAAVVSHTLPKASEPQASNTQSSVLCSGWTGPNT